jgi:NifU-like protein involved in Fe-S cluster formation
MKSPYSDRLMDHFLQPRHAGALENATAVGDARNNTCGDRTRVYLVIEGDVIREATFLGAGCGPGIACADYLLERVIGRRCREAVAVSAAEVALALELPRPKLHAAELAVAALRKALADHHTRPVAPATAEEGASP